MRKFLKNLFFKKDLKRAYKKGKEDCIRDNYNLQRLSLNNDNLSYIKLVYPKSIKVCVVINKEVYICIKSFDNHKQADTLLNMLQQ